MGKAVSMRPEAPESKEQWFKRKVAELGKALGKLPAPRRRLAHMSLNDGTPPRSEGTSEGKTLYSGCSIAESKRHKVHTVGSH
jgi:hypothetical protein